MGIVLKINRVSKTYKKRKVVSNLSFSMQSGEILGFIGPNGAGKSTTLKMICGLTKISEGEIYICDKEVSNNFKKAIARVGAMIENPTMYPYLTGRQNLKIVANFYGPEAVKRIDKIVNLVGMQNRIDDKFSTYSLGMKQRLGIAQALLNNPKLLILDEPTNGLDPNGIKEFRDLIIRLAKKAGIAVLISSHNLAELEHICDRVAIINNGRLIEYKSMREIKSILASNQKVLIKVNAPNFAGKMLKQQFKCNVKLFKNIVIVPLSDTDLPFALQYLNTKNITVYGVEKAKKSLEEVYFDILRKRRTSTGVF